MFKLAKWAVIGFALLSASGNAEAQTVIAFLSALF